MNRFPNHPFVAHLSYILIDPARFPMLDCRSCRGALELHQPDLNRPEQFLGTCTSCGRWYRVGFATGEPELIVLLLPELAQAVARQAQPPPSDDAN